MKKLLLVLGMMICLFGLTACNSTDPSGSDSGANEADQAYEEQLRSDFTSLFDQFNIFYSTGTVNEGVMQFAQQAPGMEQALISWAAGMDEIGGYVTIKEVDLIADNEVEMRVNVLIQGVERDTEMLFYNSAETMGVPQLTFAPVMDLGDKSIRALQNTILGMGTTFAVLILISLIISSFALLGKRKEKPSQSAPVEDNIQAIDQTIAQIIAKEEREGTDDSELVAVIAAAIAAAEGTTTEGFRVRSIRRANTSKWKQA